MDFGLKIKRKSSLCNRALFSRSSVGCLTSKCAQAMICYSVFLFCSRGFFFFFLVYSVDCFFFFFFSGVCLSTLVLFLFF